MIRSRETKPIEVSGSHGLSNMISPIETSTFLPITFLAIALNCHRGIGIADLAES